MEKICHAREENSKIGKKCYVRAETFFTQKQKIVTKRTLIPCTKVGVIQHEVKIISFF